MPRIAWCLSLIAVACLGVLDGAEPPPKDTLPARLSIQAIPLGLDKDRPVPKDNALTEAKVALGRRLFFDPILSADGKVSCASCHDPKHGLAGNERFPVGVGGKLGHRNAPSLFNRAYGKAFFWDGRAATLEEQALRPIESPSEMGSTVSAAVQQLKSHKEYPALFQAAFADGVTADNLAKALASFERVLLLGNSRVDKFRTGDVAALKPAELHGFWLYESRGKCWRCHTGPNFTDEAFHNTGVSWGKQPRDLGRYEGTKRAEDRGRFKTPTLRGLTRTAPYMHDGSLKTLEDVVEFYNRGGGKNPHLDPAMEPLGLTKDEVKALVEFLKALSETTDK